MKKPNIAMRSDAHCVSAGDGRICTEKNRSPQNMHRARVLFNFEGFHFSNVKPEFNNDSEERDRRDVSV